MCMLPRNHLQTTVQKRGFGARMGAHQTGHRQRVVYTGTPVRLASMPPETKAPGKLPSPYRKQSILDTACPSILCQPGRCQSWCLAPCFPRSMMSRLPSEQPLAPSGMSHQCEEFCHCVPPP